MSNAPVILKAGQTFGSALEHLKLGGRASRHGWNGKDMWIAYGAGRRQGGAAEVLPYILFKTADDKILMGWQASQTDMLAQDWQLLAPIIQGDW